MWKVLQHLFHWPKKKTSSRKYAPAAQAVRKGPVPPAKPAVPLTPVRRILEQVRSADELTRRAAILSLGLGRCQEAAPEIVRILADPHSDLRDSAAFAAGCLRIREAAPLLLQLLHDADPVLRNNAIIAVGELRVEEAIPPLILLYRESESTVTEAVTAALVGMGPPAVAALKDALDHPIPAVRWYSAKALEFIEPPSRPS